jgi:TetR/AcrR family transcriptional repressor of nem operon
MRYPADHKRETRERVLAEAAEQIRAHGPLGIGVAEIMKRAGLTHGGFYAHFTSKDSLIAAGIAKMFEGARVRWHARCEVRSRRLHRVASVGEAPRRAREVLPDRRTVE